MLDEMILGAIAQAAGWMPTTGFNLDIMYCADQIELD